MKIEHVALYVNDLENARDFFVKYLGARSNDGYHNPRKCLEKIWSYPNYGSATIHGRNQNHIEAGAYSSCAAFRAE